MSNLPQGKVESGRDVYEFGALSTTGMLWLINRAVLHPRGLALALHYLEGDPEPRGWSLHAAEEGEPFSFALPDGLENELYAEVELLIAETREHGVMPPEVKSEPH